MNQSISVLLLPYAIFILVLFFPQLCDQTFSRALHSLCLVIERMIERNHHYLVLINNNKKPREEEEEAASLTPFFKRTCNHQTSINQHHHIITFTFTSPNNNHTYSKVGIFFFFFFIFTRAGEKSHQSLNKRILSE